MKAAHRHELKTNELAEWIANLPQWAKENLRIIILVSVVAVLAAVSYFYLRYQKKVVSVQEQVRLTEFIGQLAQSKRDILSARSRGLDISYTLLRLADGLQTFARQTKNDQRAALALIKRAEALRAELHYRPKTVSRGDLTSQIRRAKDSYNGALKRLRQADSSALQSQVSLSNRSLVAMAKFGLGLCEEELGNFEGAQQIYRNLVANPDFQSTIPVAQAKRRLEAMPDYRQKVVFRTPPRPRPAPPVEPRVPLGVPDINLADINIGVPKQILAPREPNKERVEVFSAAPNLADTNLAGVNLPGP
jgi:tetratricopeptide (TPR) repeat protein